MSQKPLKLAKSPVPGKTYIQASKSIETIPWGCHITLQVSAHLDPQMMPQFPDHLASVCHSHHSYRRLTLLLR